MRHFMKDHLWTMRLDNKPPMIRHGLNSLRITILTIRMYLKNDCSVKASALTFYTLLSIIPILALGFAVAKGFGLEKRMETWLCSVLKDHPSIAEKMVEFSTNTLSGAHGGVIAGVGIIFLFCTTIKLLMQIESSFNQIWGVDVARSLHRKVSDYLSLVLLCPILIAVNGSMSAFASAQLAGMFQKMPYFTSGFTFFSSKIIPFLATWFLFTFIYVYIPNTKVKILSAMFGGFITSLLYYLVQSLYIFAQFILGSYSVIYGGFAALPLFLIWLQISWIIVLLGAQIVFSVQNVREYVGMPLDFQLLGERRKVVYALRIMRYCAIRFEQGKSAVKEEDLALDLELPVLGARQTLSDLVEAKLLSKVSSPDRSVSYQVAFMPERITAAFVLESLLNRHQECLGYSDLKTAEFLENILRNSDKSDARKPLTKILL